MINIVFKKFAKFATLFVYPKQKRKILRKNLEIKLRRNYYGKKVRKTAKYVGKHLACNYLTNVNFNTIIKDFCNFNGMTIIGPGNVHIGNYFHSGDECLILTENHNYEGNMIPYDNSSIIKDVEIGDFVWIGSRVTLLPGTKIGEGAIIQAGAVVHGEIPPYAIAGGNPAKVFKYRDIEHFKKLKENKMFLTNEVDLRYKS